MTKICYGSVKIIEQTNLVSYPVWTRVVLSGVRVMGDGQGVGGEGYGMNKNRVWFSGS